MCLWRAPEKYIAGAALDRAGLHSGLTDGSKIVTLTRLPRCTSQKHNFSAFDTHVSQGPSAAGRVR
jgi:hypothetical protein